MLSFITATYNGLEYTKDLLESFRQHTSHTDYEYIIIDDGSTDGTPEFLSSLNDKEHFRTITNSGNCGFAHANNRAARAASGDYLVFLNNDLILTPNWLEPMLLAFEQFPDIGCVGNIQFNVRSGLIDHAGVFFDLLGRPQHARKHRRMIPPEPYRFWNAVTAACMIVPKDLFLTLGGFDERYRNGTEDIDLCVRIRQRSKQIVVANRSRIYHHVSSSDGRRNHDAVNSALFLELWRPITAEWGRREWAHEYIQRNLRQFWRFNFTKLCRALWLMCLNPRSK